MIKLMIKSFIFASFAALTFLMFYPIYAAVSSFESDSFLTLAFTEFELPIPFPRYLVNSVMVTAAVIVFQLWLLTPAAYALAKLRFPGMRIINAAVDIGLLFYGVFGVSMLFSSQYIVLGRLNLINTYPALILPMIASPLAVVLLRGYAARIPDNLIESARIDGVSHVKIITYVVIPAVRPARVATVITAMASVWQMNTYGFVYSEELKLAGSVLERLQGIGDSGLTAALSLLLIGLPLAFFGIYVRSIGEAFSCSGIK